MSDEVVTSGSIGREVEGEDGVWWCKRHAKVKTRLRCGRCETPICGKCTKYGPTGARCPDCGSYKGSHVYQVAPQQYLAAVAVAVFLGSISGMIAGFVGFFALFYAPVAGTLMAKAISAVVKHKRGTALAVIASAGLVFGAMIPQIEILLAFVQAARAPVATPFPDLQMLLTSNVFKPMIWVYLGLSIPSVWYWLK